MSITGHFGTSVQAAHTAAVTESPRKDESASDALPSTLRDALDGSPTSSISSSRSSVPLSDRKSEEAQPPARLLRLARWSALGNNEQLKAQAGEPKKDLRFWFLGSWQMSTGYKAVLESVESYHNTLDEALPANAHGRVELATLAKYVEKAVTQLKALSEVTGRYLAADGHMRKGAIGIYHDQVSHELTALEGLADELRRGSEAPQANGLQLKTLMGFARQGIPLQAMAGLLESRTSPEQARQAMERAHVGPWSQELTPDDEASLYERLDIPHVERTRVKDLRDEQRVGPQKSLGSGAFNTTTEAQFDTPEGLRKLVLKPIPTTERGMALRTGISEERPRTAMRNLASCDIDQALGFNVLVKTELALVMPPPPPEKRQKELMLAMEPAPGQTGNQVDKTLLRRPAVIQKLLQLQLLDQLCAQVDRHAGNYRIDVDAQGRVTVKGYDNDQCMGDKALTAEDVAYRPDGQRGFRGVLRPPVVDTDTARALEDMTSSQLRSILKDMSSSEIHAAVNRLTDIKLHLADLRKKGRIVPMAELADRKNFMHFTGRNSYVMRDWLRVGY